MKDASEDCIPIIEGYINAERQSPILERSKPSVAYCINATASARSLNFNPQNFCQLLQVKNVQVSVSAFVLISDDQQRSFENSNISIFTLFTLTHYKQDSKTVTLL